MPTTALPDICSDECDLQNMKDVLPKRSNEGRNHLLYIFCKFDTTYKTVMFRFTAKDSDIM